MSGIRVFMATICLLAASTAVADPCGMVPPIYPGQQVPLARVGEQMTYVFYKDGVETFVIRPGFSGKVEDFGMLIPFPNPPALRKVSDEIFPHIAAAIDPPEVVLHLGTFYRWRGRQSGQFAKRKKGNSLGVLEEDEVRVVREEAVGMYEVAVLEAGSSAALKRWIDDHGFKYPGGMDKVCDEYIEEKWCFVAVKTSVGVKQLVNAKAGQRDVSTRLPAGKSFDGHVQAMGFRFESEELVVPMRLSAFNEGELRNIVYLMTDSPKRIRGIPEEYVVRQISGKQLIANLTEPLPLRIIGGTEGDIPESRRKSLVTERNPTPKNGAAKILFASDLEASTTNTLSLPHEEDEKELLRIGEQLGLRGMEIDQLHAKAISEQRATATDGAIKRLQGMTLTVVDGDFPRELIASRNLTFGEYQMPRQRNQSSVYNARTKTAERKQPGTLRLGAIDWSAQDKLSTREPQNWLVGALAAIGVAGACFGFVFLRRRR